MVGSQGFAKFTSCDYPVAFSGFGTGDVAAARGIPSMIAVCGG
jgi:hypothetical protein